MSRDPDDVPADGARGLSPELAQRVDEATVAPDLDHLYARLRVDLEREQGLRGWLRARSTLARGLLAFGAVVLAGVVIALGFARPDLGSYPPDRLAVSLAAMALVMAVSMALALRPLQRAALPGWVGPLAVTCSLLLLAGLYLIAPLEAPRALFEPGVFGPALRCLGTGLALGVPVYGVLVLLDRGGSRRAVPMALAAGMAANLVLHIHCPSGQPSHLMLGHFGAAALLLLAIALWARSR